MITINDHAVLYIIINSSGDGYLCILHSYLQVHEIYTVCDVRWLLTRARLLDGLGVAEEERADIGTGLVTDWSCDFTPRVKYPLRSAATVADQSEILLTDCDANTSRRASFGSLVMQPSLYSVNNTYPRFLSSNNQLMQL